MTNGVSLLRLQEIIQDIHDQLNEIDDFCHTSKTYSEKYFYAKGKLEAIANFIPLILALDEEIV